MRCVFVFIIVFVGCTSANAPVDQNHAPAEHHCSGRFCDDNFNNIYAM